MKETLLQLIEMYSSARGTGNGALISYAVKELNGFLQAVEITQVVPVEQEEKTED